MGVNAKKFKFGSASSFVDPQQRLKAVETRKSCTALRLLLNIPSPLKVIRDNCLVCTGGSSAEIKACGITHCAMWPYRFGRNPKEDDLKLPVYDDVGKLVGHADYPGYSQDEE